jgi:DNA-binding transcriptional LysR family regulator
MNQLEARDIEYFLAVADELHFGRAAERLGIAQPPLSRAIARLERRLGTALFERTTRRVSLTAAGSVFVEECGKVLAAMDTAVRRTQQAAQTHVIHMAVRPGAGPGVLADLLNAYRLLPGAAQVEVLFTYDEAEALRNGSAEISIMCSSTGTRGLDFIELGLEHPVALLPTGHRLATRSTLTVAELGGLDAYADTLPHQALDVIVDRVLLGELVVVVGHSVLDRLGRAVVAVPVEDFPPARLVLAWPAGTQHRARSRLIETAASWRRVRTGDRREPSLSAPAAAVS